MWEWLKDASQKVMESGAAYLQHRAFIQSLFNMPQEQAYGALKQKIDELDDEGIQIFSNALAAMINEAQQAAQQSNDTAWGTSYEDRLAYSVARFQSGEPAPQNTQAQMYLQGLNAVAQFANQFYQEKLARGAQTQVASGPQTSNAPQTSPQVNQSSQSAPAGPVDTSQLEAMLETLVQNGQLDPALMQQLTSLNDPAAIDKILAKLKEMGADEGSSPPLNIADYYQPRNKKYNKLKWPLSPSLPLPVPFDQLDEETQFHVLFGEWTRREMEGTQALYSGDADAAEATFKECLERAKQLNVAELKARSFEGFVRIAQKRGDRKAERKWIKAASDARQNG